IELFKITLRHLRIDELVKVKEVLDGEAALDFMRTAKDIELPDLILLDLKLPKLDGKEILAEVKSDDRLCRIPVIIFSSSDAWEDIQETYRLGASCYVKKATDFDQMQQTIKNLVEFWFHSVSLPRGSHLYSSLRK